VHVYSALNAGRVSALVTLVGNEFQEEMVRGTNECKNSWCEQMVEKTHYIGIYWGKVQKLMKEKG